MLRDHFSCANIIRFLVEAEENVGTYNLIYKFYKEDEPDYILSQGKLFPFMTFDIKHVGDYFSSM